MSGIDRRAALAGLALAGGFPMSAGARARRRWRTIFDGRSLAGWSQVGDANWGLKDGVVQADRGSGFLVSDQDYGDHEIRVEIWVSHDANSGIFVRCADPREITTSNSYEFNVFDERPDPTYGTGAIVGVAKVSPMPKAGERWSLLEIAARADRLSFTVNGVRTVENHQDSAHARGRIALQYGAGVVKFRKVQVRLL